MISDCRRSSIMPGHTMIDSEVIKEIYLTNPKPPKHLEDLRLYDVIEELSQYHAITVDNDDLSKAEVILEDLEEYNPFRRFLVRGLHAILDIDNVIAFVFGNHILFLNKDNNGLRVHFNVGEDCEDEMAEEEKSGFFRRLFGKR